MIDRCYLEITNICNLNCVFCPKNDRTPRRLSAEEFSLLTDRLAGMVKFLYFHLMGEPMLHPLLPDFIAEARDKGFIPVLTTNGTLISSASRITCQEEIIRTTDQEYAISKADEEAIAKPLKAISHRLLEHLPYKIQISLHSHEGNGKVQPEAYIREVMTFSIEAARRGCVVVLRLWNQGGYDSENVQLLDLLASYVPRPWTERPDGYRLTDHLYLEYDRMFEWPDAKGTGLDEPQVFCYALQKQIGVLVDGSVVPCCLDHAGSVPLGNLFRQTLYEVLASPRAVAMLDGFRHHVATEALCRNCESAAIGHSFRRTQEGAT